jgi:hypothetical protein
MNLIILAEKITEILIERGILHNAEKVLEVIIEEKYTAANSITVSKVCPVYNVYKVISLPRLFAK